MGASGIRGVYRTVDPRKPWGGKVQHEGRAHYVGWHLTREDAAKAVERKRIELGIHDPGLPDLISHLLAERYPDIHAELSGEGSRRIEAAKALAVSPFSLPDGWDLA